MVVGWRVRVGWGNDLRVEQGRGVSWAWVVVLYCRGG